MDRIAIIGCGGSGKSHLAHQIGTALGITPVHLDTLYYDKNWNPLAASAGTCCAAPQTPPETARLTAAAPTAATAAPAPVTSPEHTAAAAITATIAAKRRHLTGHTR